MKRTLAVSLVLMFTINLAGCISLTPESLTENIKPVDLNAARDNPDQYRDRRVKLAGEIVSLDSLKDSTVIEVVSRDMSRSGRPIVDSDNTQGRFLAVFRGFLDPANYSEGREITVIGLLSGIREQPIGDYLYQYPVVTVESHHLWKKLPASSRYDDVNFWFYGPWYGYPGYRFGYDPYWDTPYYW